MSASHAAAAQASFDLDPFAAIEASAGIRVLATQGDVHTARAEADTPELLDRLKIEVRDGTLYVAHQSNLFEFLFEGGIFGLSDGTQRTPVTVHVTLPLIEAATAHSGAQLQITEVPVSATLDVSAQSGAEVEWTGIDAETIDAQASSGGMLRLSGICDALGAEASAGGSLSAQTLFCQAVRAGASAGGQITIHAIATVDAKASTGGMIVVHGQPEDSEINESIGGQVTLATD